MVKLDSDVPPVWQTHAEIADLRVLYLSEVGQAQWHGDRALNALAGKWPPLGVMLGCNPTEEIEYCAQRAVTHARRARMLGRDIRLCREYLAMRRKLGV